MSTSLPPRIRGYIAPELASSATWCAMLDAPVAALTCDEEGQLLLANQAMLDLLALPISELLGTRWIPRLWSGLDDLHSALSTAGTLRHRKELTTAAGEVRMLEMTCSAVMLPKGVRGVVALAVEVAGSGPSPRPRAGGPKSEGRGYRELVEDTLDVMMRFEAGTGRLVFVNRAIERQTGFAPEQFLSDETLFGRVVAREYRAVWEAAFAQVERGDARSFDLELKHKDGRQVLLQQALHPIRDAAGQVRFIEGTARDVTTVRQIETLKARNDERASLDRLKSQLLANVSHELRTPLVSIKGYNDLLLRGALGPLTPKQKRGLEIASANTDRLIELIESLLDFQRREEGRLELDARRVDLRQAVEDAGAALAGRIASRNLALELDLGNEPLWVMGDRPRLAQVFRALLANAEKFSEAGVGEVHVTAHAGVDFAQVSVADRGIGIPKHAHARIFDRFYQVDASSTRRFGGAGVGLALAKELVALHGGSIEVVSAEGMGSTFTVRLPLLLGERAVPVVGGAARPVVLVGAAPETLPELERALLATEPQPSLLVAHDPEELLTRARRHRPDLVVVGFADPEPVVCSLKRDADAGTLPVVALTPDGLPVSRADLSIAKEAGLLPSAVRRLLERKPSSGRAARVVVVEDELEILDFTRFVLERAGYDVVCLSEGVQALAQVDGECDLVILDIALEDTDGIEVCRRLRENPATRDVPVLVMTAMSGEEVRALALKAGANGYLVKPFGVDEFLRQVQLHARPAPGPGRTDIAGAPRTPNPLGRH